MKYNTATKLNGIPHILIFFVVFVLGVAFLVGSLMMGPQEIPENFITVQATIDDIEEVETHDSDGTKTYFYNVTISYTVGDDSYSGMPYSKYDSSMKVGGTVEIYVDPDNTGDYMTDDSDFVIFPILSAIFAVVGAVGVVINVNKLINLKRSKENG